MRVPLLAILALVVACPASVRGDTPGGDVLQDRIDAKELKKYFTPYVPGVKDCYVANTKAHEVDGTLRLELVIHPAGNVHRFGFQAPRLKGTPLRKLDKCLRELSETWHFPQRRGFTTAVLPFKFQRTFAPGAGPKATGGH